MQEYSNEQLARKAANGDGKAFELLVEGNYDMIFRVAYKWCGNKEDAEDIAHDACIKISNNIDNFRGDCAFSTWIYRLVVNVAKDFHKSNSRKQNRESAYVELNVIENSKPSGEDNIMVRELMKAVHSLKPKIRDAILLVYSEELNHAEAAEILDCSEKTISWRVFKGKKQLKEILGGS